MGVTTTPNPWGESVSFFTYLDVTSDDVGEFAIPKTTLGMETSGGVGQLRLSLSQAANGDNYQNAYKGEMPMPAAHI